MFLGALVDRSYDKTTLTPTCPGSASARVEARAIAELTAAPAGAALLAIVGA
jgi:hypothetical protein